MNQPDLALSAYLQLAVISHERGQWLPRNKFLILAGDAACREGLPAIADRCRTLIVSQNRAHIIGKYASFAAAMQSPEFQTYLKQQRKFCSVERAEHLLAGQGREVTPATAESAVDWLRQISGAVTAEDSSRANPARFAKVWPEVKVAKDWDSMNKAFVRDPEQGLERCPQCGSVGEPVGLDTVTAFLRPEFHDPLSDSAHFCPYPACDVVYFDMFERVVLTRDIVRPVYPKDPTAPLCGCFGLNCEDVEDDVAEGGVVRLKAHLARAKSADAQCRTKSVNGKTCIEDVQRYFFKCRGGT